MKQLFFITAFLLLGLGAIAQKPEPVYSFALVYKPSSWYREQTKAWKAVLDREPQNSRAWYYYYYATRNLNATDIGDKRSPEEKHQSLEKIVADMEKVVPESYEFHLVKWMSSGYDNRLIHHLQKANDLGPDRWEHLDFMVNIGETSRDAKLRNSYALRKYHSGNFSPGMLYYNHNVIAGLEPNAIIFTAGDNDTYPIWVLQALGVRPDITVINFSLIQLDDYRERLFRELGIEDFGKLHSDNPTRSGENYAEFKKDLVRRVAANKKDYPVYVALSASGDFISGVENHLYLTGLAYQYSESPLDNMAIMRRNFEQLYALDYLEHVYYNDISAELVKTINANYVVPMLKLYDHYRLSGDSQRQNWIRKKILEVSKDHPNEKEIKNYIAQK